MFFGVFFFFLYLSTETNKLTCCALVQIKFNFSIRNGRFNLLNITFLAVDSFDLSRSFEFFFASPMVADAKITKITANSMVLIFFVFLFYTRRASDAQLNVISYSLYVRINRINCAAYNIPSCKLQWLT